MVQLTLSERVARLEKFLEIGSGMPVDRNADEAAQTFYNRYRSGEETDTVERHFEQAQPRPKLADQTAFEEIIARISNCTDRVCLTADKLQRIGNRIMGALPEGVNAGEEMCNPQESPDGTLDHTFMALNWLDESLCRLEQVALRMERV